MIVTTQNSTVPPTTAPLTTAAIAPASLTYEGPEEVLVKTPILLQGRYDRATIDDLTLMAEDQCTFQISLDPATGQWTSNLDEGFYTAGSRWLRLQGHNATGQVISEQVIHLTVSSEPLSVGQAVQVHILQDTLFKVLPLDSSVLNDRQLLPLKAGQSLAVDRYGYTDGYLRLELPTDLGKLGRVGYVDAAQVTLTKGRERLPVDGDQQTVILPGPVQVQVLQDTWLKTQPLDSAHVAPSQRCRLQRGQQLMAFSYGCQRGHFRLSLPVASFQPQAFCADQVSPHPVSINGHSTDIAPGGSDRGVYPSNGDRPGDGGIDRGGSQSSNGHAGGNAGGNPDNGSTPGAGVTPAGVTLAGVTPAGVTPAHQPLDFPLYVPWTHVQLSQGVREIPFDPDALTLTVTQDSVFKKWPVNRSNLREGEYCSLPQGSVYGLLGYSPTGEHVKVAFTENLPGFGNAGYCLRHQIQVRRGVQGVDLGAVQVELNVPSVAQIPSQGEGVQGGVLAAIAMTLAYHGVRSQRPTQSLVEELYQDCQQRYGSPRYLDSSLVVRLVQRYGFEASFSTNHTWGQVRQRISQGQPVVVESYCTHQGHGLCIIGFTPTGYVVNDPWGNALRGYRDRRGSKVFYSHAYLHQMCRLGGQGQIGAYFIAPGGSDKVVAARSRQ